MLLPLLLLAFALRIYNLAGTEFWFDEALTANVSGLGWQGILAHLRSAPFEHPPLYFLSLYPWQRLLGTSEFAFRIYSVFWGVLFIALLYTLVRLLANRQLALMAATVASFSPFLVAYSREARMYSLLPCLAVLTILLFFRALRQPERPAWWLAYLVMLATGVATHYFFAWIWLANSLFLALLALQKRRISHWAVAAHVTALAVVLVWLLAAPGLRASLARVWLVKGDTAAALKEAAAALKIVNNHGPAKLVEADALAKQGDIDLAIVAYEKGHGLMRTDPKPLVHAARATLDGGRPTTARAFAERATQSFPGWGPAWEALGDVALAAGDKRTPRPAYQKALGAKGPVDKTQVQKKLAKL